MTQRRFRIVLSAALVTVLVLALWLLLSGSRQSHCVTVGFSTARGHFPEPGLIYGDQILIAWVTNTGPTTITLADPYVQFENMEGRLVEDHGVSWNQEGYSASLSPGRVAWLANGFDRDRKRLRFVFQYRMKGGLLLTLVNKAVSRFPVKRLPQRTYVWLQQKGMIDGTVVGHYESPWIVDHDSTASPNQAIR